MKTVGSILRQGLIAGAIGYATIVLFFAIINVIAGRPFYFTAEQLGTVVFGAAGTGAVLAANGVHIIVSILLATIAATAAWIVERQPIAWYFVFFLLLVAVLGGSVFLGAVASDFAAATTWIALAAGNIVATIAMGVTIWWMHPVLRGIMHEAPE